MAVDVKRQEVLEQLSTVQDPDLHRDLVSLGMIQDLAIQGTAVNFAIVLTTPACPVKNDMKEWCRAAVARLPWVQEVNVDLRSQTVAGRTVGQGQLIPKVKNVIAVASGKGGVGKTTTSVNVSVALAETGARVGLLDADIYGPNIPLMMGIQGKPEMQSQEGRIDPLSRFGIKLMSIGFFLDENNPVIWRGPMVHGAIQQFLRDVDWGELDYLVVDLPPGTGDAPLSLAQLVPMSGAVIVTTPQDVALQDVSKGMAMFRKLEVPLIGVIENMSYFVCPNCDSRHEIFGRGGGEKIALHYGVPFLGKIPLQGEVREGGDEGRPIMVTQPRSVVAEAFRAVAGAIAQQVSILAYAGNNGNFIPLNTITLNR
jgi:ATP-binding protein involved in chromosome partitioning